MLAVRDRSSTGSASEDGDTGGGGDGDSAGELVAVVELTIRQPDGSLPFNWPFPIPWRRQVSATYQWSAAVPDSISCYRFLYQSLLN